MHATQQPRCQPAQRKGGMIMRRANGPEVATPTSLWQGRRSTPSARLGLEDSQRKMPDTGGGGTQNTTTGRIVRCELRCTSDRSLRNRPDTSGRDPPPPESKAKANCWDAQTLRVINGIRQYRDHPAVVIRPPRPSSLPRVIS